MSCASNLALLSDLYDGSLGESESRVVRKHLEGCAGCREVYNDLGSLIAGAGQAYPLDAISMPDEDVLWNRIRGSMR